MFKKTCLALIVLLVAATVLTACGGPKQPDLIPSPPQYVNFCERSADGSRLVVHVKNIGTADAASAEVQVEFFIASGSSQTVNGISVTGVLAPGSETSIEVPIPAGCFNPDCDFKITIDPSNVVPESNETNNKVDGSCLG